MTKRVLQLGAKSNLAFSAAWPQVAFWLLVALLLFTRLAGPMRLAYPFMAVVVGWRLIHLSTASYVSFVIWLWFLSPVVRRIADMFAGFYEPSFVLVAPYLVAGLSLLRILERMVWLRQPPVRMAGAMMFGIAALAIATGVPLGLIAAPLSAIQEMLNWFVPLCLGWYLASEYQHLHQIERQLFVTFGRAALVAGAYGIFQFTSIPPWDVGWMVAVEMTSIGLPEPFEVRVFSTMHSPGVLAFFLAMALVFFVARPSASGIPTAAFAGVTILLSQVRASWFSFALSVLLVVPKLKATQQIRTVMLLVIAVMGTSAFLLTPEMSELFGNRVSTIERLEEDDSALSRMAGHVAALDYLAGNPVGAGIGRGDPDVEALISLRDSVLVSVMVQFGVVGTLLYMLAFFMLFTQLWRYYRQASTREGMALAATAIGFMAGSAFSLTNAGPTGMLLWMIGGLATADRHLARQRLAAVQAQAQRLVRSRAAGVPQRAAG